MKESKYFFYCILPLILTSCAVGMCPMLINFKKKRPTVYTSKYLYCINIGYIILYSILLVRTISEARSKLMSNSYYQSNKIPSIGIAFMFFGGVVYLYTIYITCLFKTESIKRTLIRISEVDRILEKFNQDLKYVRCFIYQIVTQSVAVIFIVINVSMQQYNIKRERFRPLSVTTLFLFAFPVTIVNVFGNQFAYIVLLIQQRFAMINQQLKKLNIPLVKIAMINVKEPRSRSTLRKIDLLMRLHDELCSVSNKVSNNYTIALGVNLVFQYGICLFCVFYCYWMYSIKPFSSLCWLAWGFVKMGEVVHISVSSHLAAQNALETGTIVHKLLLNPFQTEIGPKLIAFSKQLMHAKVEFTIWGLFPIDATLLYTMTSAAATYMIIMLQFQQASLPMTCKTNVANRTVS